MPGRCAASRHLAEVHPQVLIIALEWLMAPEQSELFTGYNPSKFHAALELVGIFMDGTEVKSF